MFRKVLLALTATLALGAAALVPTAASAGGGHHGHGHHGHHGHWGHGHGGFRVSLYAPAYTYGYGLVGGCYTVKRWVDTPFGPKFRRVTVCN